MDLDLWDCLGRVKTYFLVIRQFFFLPNNPKNRDPSYKMDLDLWDCLGRVKQCIIVKLHRTDLVICSHSKEGKIPS